LIPVLRWVGLWNAKFIKGFLGLACWRLEWTLIRVRLTGNIRSSQNVAYFCFLFI
jgi:hypothetical protein